MFGSQPSPDELRSSGAEAPEERRFSASPPAQPQANAEAPVHDHAASPRFEPAAAKLAPHSSSSYRPDPPLPTAVYLNAAHELRAPLARMVEEIESLREPDHGALSTTQAAIARNLALTCRRMQRLVEECFTYGRMVNNDIPISLQNVDLHQLFAELGTAWEPAYAKKNVRLELLPDPEHESYRCDPHKLLRIVSVLLENALKFTPPDGVVSLRWFRTAWDGPEAADSALRIEVQDTGCGVATSDQASIFQPFVRLTPDQEPLESGARRGTSNYLRRRDDTAPGVGLGLGLAVAVRLVDLHHGRIWVESQPPHGSNFLLLLPQFDSASAAAVE